MGKESNQTAKHRIVLEDEACDACGSEIISKLVTRIIAIVTVTLTLYTSFTLIPTCGEIRLYARDFDTLNHTLALPYSNTVADDLMACKFGVERHSLECLGLR